MSTTITITMHDSHIASIEQIKEFLQLNNSFQFTINSKQEKYLWIEEALRKFRYHSLEKKKEKSIVCSYIRRVTKLSKAQLKRLVKKHKQCGKLVPNYSNNKGNGFHTTYEPKDIALLINTDFSHDHLNGQATRKILKREYTVFDRTEYKTIANISQSHIYNIRNHNQQYNSSRAKYKAQTRASQVDIGIRSKPRPEGKPGFLRVDTVHSGDLNGQKGLYHLNIVDEATQWEMVATIEKISEYYLKPVIEELLEKFPFKIHEFHSDNGSEFINHIVAELLAKIYVKLTKSRARHSNDNALVESKNGSVIRKLYGRNHIPQKHAKIMNEFNRQYVNTYLNYHRPCGFAEDHKDKKGKIKKKYNQWMTPHEKFMSLKNTKQYLRSKVTLGQLDAIAYEMSDNEFAKNMQQAKVALFKKIRGR